MSEAFEVGFWVAFWIIIGIPAIWFAFWAVICIGCAVTDLLISAAKKKEE